MTANRSTPNVVTCDGCGLQTSDMKATHWTSLDGTWSTAVGMDTFHGHLCVGCTCRIGHYVLPLCTRNRVAGIVPRVCF